MAPPSPLRAFLTNIGGIRPALPSPVLLSCVAFPPIGGLQCGQLNYETRSHFHSHEKPDAVDAPSKCLSRLWHSALLPQLAKRTKGMARSLPSSVASFVSSPDRAGFNGAYNRG